MRMCRATEFSYISSRESVHFEHSRVHPAVCDYFLRIQRRTMVDKSSEMIAITTLTSSFLMISSCPTVFIVFKKVLNGAASDHQVGIR